jgi:RimJ/RimL family protein N-acetyltransferase
MRKEDITIKQWEVDDWQTFKDVRLEALKGHGDVFGASFENEKNKDDNYWKGNLTDCYAGAVFGLYDREEAIGLTAVFRHRERMEDTAILCMSYIRKQYRGLELSDLLYKARIDWAKAQEGITRILVGHREGNEASRRANQRWGFKLYSVEDYVFGNGETAKEYMYELKI